MQHEQIHTNLFPSRKFKCIVPRHFSAAFRGSGKPFRGCGKIPGRSGVKIVSFSPQTDLSMPKFWVEICRLHWIQKFVQQTAKASKKKIKEFDVEAVSEAFTTNSIHGSSLTRLDDSDWTHLIPNVWVHIELQTAITRKIREEQVVSKGRSTFYCKGLPKKV